MKIFIASIMTMTIAVNLTGQANHKNLRNGDMLYGFEK